MVKIDFTSVILERSTVDDLHVALCSAFIAALILEVHKYAQYNFEKQQ